MTTSATSSTLSVIAHGVFTAAGVDHSGSKVDTLVFANGSFKMTHTGKARQNVQPEDLPGHDQREGCHHLVRRHRGLQGHQRQGDSSGEHSGHRGQVRR
jgi:hypothetical protein